MCVCLCVTEGGKGDREKIEKPSYNSTGGILQVIGRSRFATLPQYSFSLLLFCFVCSVVSHSSKGKRREGVGWKVS